jgi:hypothetical protein
MLVTGKDIAKALEACAKLLKGAKERAGGRS